MQDELSKQKNATTRKRKNVTNQKEGVGQPAKRWANAPSATTHSISPSPSLSRPASVNSMTTSETLNGGESYIDVVGGVEQDLVPRLPNHVTPPKILGKRGRQSTKGSNNVKRSKATRNRGRGGVSAAVSKRSPSNSFPSSPCGLHSNGTNSSSPKVSPTHFSYSGHTVQ